MSKLKATYVVVNGQVTKLPTGLNSKIVLEVPGVIAVANDVAEFEVRPPGRFRIDQVILTVKTAPTGADLIAQVQVDAADIFAAADRPTIAAGATSGTSGAPLAASRLVDQNSVITLDIDQVGSMVAGADLAAHLIGQVEA